MGSSSAFHSQLVYRRVGDGYVALRALSAGDAGALRALSRELSPDTYRRRFGGPGADIGDARARTLVDVDQEGHLAWGAFVVSGIGGIETALVGEARLIRDAPNGEVGVLSLVVHADWRRRGVASALLTQLFDRAAALGVRRVSAEAAHAVPARAVLAGFGVVRAAGDTSIVLDLAREPRPAAPSIRFSLTHLPSTRTEPETPCKST